MTSLEKEKKEKQEKDSINKYYCDKCKDTGWILTLDINTGEITTKRCDCHELYLKQKKAARLQMPKEFEGIRLVDFKTDIYKNESKYMSEVKKAIKRYLRAFKKYHKNGKGIFMHSKAKGSGKTYMMAIIGNELVNAGYSVRFAKTHDILNLIKSTYSKDSKGDEESVLKQIVSIDVLLIDDIGTERATEWVNEQFNYIIDKRMIAKKVTLFTSNCCVDDLKLDPRIVNRINKMALPIRFPEISIRNEMSKHENGEMMNELFKEE